MSNEKCIKHEQIPIFYNTSQKFSLFKNLCQFCVAEFKNEEYQRLQNILIQENEEICSNNSALLYQIKENMIQHKQYLIVALESLINDTNQQINLIKKSTKAFKSLISQIPIIDANQFISNYQQIKTQLPNYQNIKDNLLNKIYLFEKSNFIHEIETKLKYFNEDNLNHSIYINQHKLVYDNSLQSNKKNTFRYELIQKFSIKQTEICNTIAINMDQQIVAVGCQEKIKIFEFIDGQLNETQVLSEHTKNINCLSFMVHSNSLISGSDDNTIRIWTKIQNNLWISLQTLNLHKDQVYCLIINNKEDLIISGSKDKSIIFWGNQNEWLQIQTINAHKDCIYSLSLNEQQNTLISCGKDNTILVIQQENKIWVVIQTIKVEQFGYRICYINKNSFSFQPINSNKLQIYQMNDNLYSKTKEISIMNGNSCDLFFPQKFIKQKSFLVNKNGSHVNFVQFNQNFEYLMNYSIHFNSSQVFGTLSEDGEYLISWDNNSKEIQIRKYIHE
ncbi:unnamed protein product [Paramecium pentaurelia]|uniref:WD domain, G-beta repeat protein n=1 Tax=Paramecium pentaurelia TaxID=43138 RepID=A0A8S1XBL5_9CILI|nr:unnamed protein product [Paramecium pentaurelia]